jgi:hypothetical protein
VEIMMFGFWHKAREHKENIFYAIVTIFLLERVRTGWNKLESQGRKSGATPAEVSRGQRGLLVKASLLYALPLLLPVLKYIYRSIEELSWSVQGLVVLKNTWAFLGVLVMTECFLAIIIFNLLKIYVDRMNAAVGFFTAIGRNVWDGSKAAVQAGSDVGSKVVGGVRSLGAGAWRTSKSFPRKTAAALTTVHKGLRSAASRLGPKRRSHYESLERLRT